jgi:hypothetical protein
LALALLPSDAHAQIRWQDLVVTLGGSLEGYSGNFSAVTVSVVDSTQEARSAIGDVGVRGEVSMLGDAERSFAVTFDAGMRQSAATGFVVRDYAPREWVGSTGARYTELLASFGRIAVVGSLRGRAVEDRPPMPLFLQPGYLIATGGVGFMTRSFDGLVFDAFVDAEAADYTALEFIPQLDLLDRTGAAMELGVRWGATSLFRLSGGVRWTEYGKQGSFDPGDPFRRDRTTRLGLEWMHEGTIVAEIGLDGTVNRSNSRRPEYDALSLRALVQAPLPGDLTMSIYGVVTGKSYLSETAFARLVPGEEADNASIAYVEVARPFASNLDGAFRLGWTRAETDIGNAYYQRLGGSLRFNYRPLGG